MNSDYELIDSGDGRKLERFGRIVVDRPCVQGLWGKSLPQSEWDKANAVFVRVTDKEGHWKKKGDFPSQWNINIGDVTLKISPTPFGHMGLFPEHLTTWEWLKDKLGQLPTAEPRILNLFAYSGASTMACAKAGAFTVHLDASRPIIGWAKENAKLSGIQEDRIAWVLEDVNKFLEREVRRGRSYDGIILDPPSFGRGPKKELFKIESDLVKLLASCRQLLAPGPNRFVLASCHTPGISAQILENLVRQEYGDEGEIESGEMMNVARTGVPLPTGLYCHWVRSP